MGGWKNMVSEWINEEMGGWMMLLWVNEMIN